MLLCSAPILFEEHSCIKPRWRRWGGEGGHRKSSICRDLLSCFNFKWYNCKNLYCIVKQHSFESPREKKPWTKVCSFGPLVATLSFYMQIYYFSVSIAFSKAPPGQNLFFSLFWSALASSWASHRAWPSKGGPIWIHELLEELRRRLRHIYHLKFKFKAATSPRNL